jgi:hypothetical protein
MGATNRFSEASWELRMAFLKPPEECTQFPGGFRKAICSSHAAVEQLFALQQEGLGNICENSKAFCKR